MEQWSLVPRLLLLSPHLPWAFVGARKNQLTLLTNEITGYFSLTHCHVLPRGNRVREYSYHFRPSGSNSKLLLGRRILMNILVVSLHGRTLGQTSRSCPLPHHQQSSLTGYHHPYHSLF